MLTSSYALARSTTALGFVLFALLSAGCSNVISFPTEQDAGDAGLHNDAIVHEDAPTSSDAANDAKDDSRTADVDAGTNDGSHASDASTSDATTTDAAVCGVGYRLGTSGCEDINECAEGNGGCDRRTTCTNTPGSFTCSSCPSGFTGTGLASCVDINECDTSNGGCAANVTCTNTPGARTCGPCPSGYTGNGETCADINECSTNNGGCAANQNCSNLPGTFMCSACPSGFTADGQGSCRDIDECTMNNGGCDVRTTCSNTQGGFTCGACPTGFSGDGRTGCVDINECNTSNGGCATGVVCTNTPGARTCGPCPSGYTGNGETCTDINECSTNNGGCAASATCTNTPGSFSCSRPRSYTVTWNGDTGREELRSVDPATLATTFVATIPGVYWTSDYYRNPHTRRIHFRGQGETGPARLYTLNADTGAILSQPEFPPFTVTSFDPPVAMGLNFGAGIHIMANGDAFTVTWNGEAGQEELRRVNLETLATTFVAAIPNITTTSDYFTDPQRRRVYFRAGGPNIPWRLFALNVDTGVILSQPDFPPFTWNAETQTGSGLNFGAGIHIMTNGDAFTVTWNGATGREELHRVNLETLTTTFVAAIPEILLTSGYYTDSETRRIYVQAYGATGPMRLFALSADTGTLLSQPELPPFSWDWQTQTGSGLNFGAGIHFLQP